MVQKMCIMGMASGYHFGDVRPFLSSLRRTGYSGRVILFVSPTTRDCDKMEAAGAELVHFERVGDYEQYSYNALRYLLYRKWLDECAERFDRILFTDVRDVIFQQDPAEFLWPEGLSITLEDAHKSIGTCPYMKLWLVGHLGHDAWEALRDCRISCSGTTCGDPAAIDQYLAVMLPLLRNYTPGKSMAGYDQGVHNFMLHNGLLERVTRFDNSGPILTLAYKQGLPEQTSEGTILNDSGVPAVLVHQYDRKPELFRQIREAFKA